ncbi:hypothetical protein Salat_0195900 [Sesamum alatum]|uniref:Uncharacterized protein n=1 Tax=Sesamum alatum TaxID=300844 RepID=A0AAE1YY49_9LAMI|nr:hypothetical protein Salat_0195900 [Sesamum alatum]
MESLAGGLLIRSARVSRLKAGFEPKHTQMTKKPKTAWPGSRRYELRIDHSSHNATAGYQHSQHPQGDPGLPPVLRQEDNPHQILIPGHPPIREKVVDSGVRR